MYPPTLVILSSADDLFRESMEDSFSVDINHSRNHDVSK